MFAKVQSLGVWGIDGFIVTVEVDISGGLPQFAIVGLPDNAVKEASDRVRSALKNMGFSFPPSRITVNLAPADVKKSGSVYDLPILLGILAASEQIPPLPQGAAFIGELSLDGEVRPVRGALSMAIACLENGGKELFLPSANAAEAAVVKGIASYPVQTASQIVQHLRSAGGKIAPQEYVQATPDDTGMLVADFADVHGQLEARRAMEIAAVGLHNVIMVGPPGSGKSMLAKRLPSILPPITQREAIETSKIYSAAGLLQKQGQNNVLIGTRPFRAPHHSVSTAGLAGGGSQPKPGEISLSHNGVLFLDELPEFKREALEILRQPLEDATITVSRVAGSITYPCRLMLVAAMNPCPCGFFGHATKECRCQMPAIERYLQKVSGPLLDRIDLHVDVQPVAYDEISAASGGENSATIRQRVLNARKYQNQRTGGKGSTANSALVGDALRKACPLTERAERMLKQAFERMGLSARGYDRVLRVSRTIADLEEAEVIDIQHVSEAVQYRNLDRKYWHVL